MRWGSSLRVAGTPSRRRVAVSCELISICSVVRETVSTGRCEPTSHFDEGAAADSLNWVVRPRARDHGCELWHGLPLGREGDQRKDRVRRLEPRGEHAGILRLSEARHLLAAMGRPLGPVGGRATL
jgi:hypothetical protein